MPFSLLIPLAGAAVMAVFAAVMNNKKKPEGTLVACLAFVLFLVDVVYNFNRL